jgi:hypoxia up-regulated 1
MRPPLLSGISLLVLLLCIVRHALASVLAIDYGTEWSKAALVKPGIPLQIVLTKDSKRKEQSVVAFKTQERVYGVDAANLVSPAHASGITPRPRGFRSPRTRR